MFSRQARRKAQSLSLLLIGTMILAIALSLTLTARTASAASPHVDVMVLNTDIGPTSLQFLTQSISNAASDGAQALVIEVDTPGGDIGAMKSMTEAELNTTVPIIAYVSPTGGYAASAGAFVTLAAQVAAMAPTTRIGASSPVDITGADLGSTLKAKLEQDLVASMTGIQNRYHRSVDLATKMVTDAASYDDATAVSQGIVDLEANSLTDLLTKVDGKSVQLLSGSVTLHTAGDTVQMVQPSLFDNVYGFLLDPNVIFLLFILAMIGIYLEISHPGAILPGTVGAIALLLFLFGIGTLSLNWAGLGLMVLAFALLVLDVRLPTHGILTVGAMISLIFGALLFFNSGGPYGGPQVDPLLVYIMAGLMGLISFTLITFIVRAQRRPVTTGVEGMIGAKVTAITPLLPEGRVSYGGENWAAMLNDPTTSVDANTELQVVAVDGLRLFVQPLHLIDPVDVYTRHSLE
jgi:membrane-bound serine protease (ClpP class)